MQKIQKKQKLIIKKILMDYGHYWVWDRDTQLIKEYDKIDGIFILYSKRKKNK